MLLYNGQLDIIVGVPLTENFLRQLNWSGQTEYMSAPRTIWRLGDANSDVAGYVKQVGRFRQVCCVRVTMVTITYTTCVSLCRW